MNILVSNIARSQKLLFLAIFVTGTLIALSLPLYAHAASTYDKACHTIEYSDGLVPQFASFGSPSNLFDSSEQLLMRIMCNSNEQAKVILGNSNPQLLIYQYGFEIVNGGYERVRLTGPTRRGSWIVGRAEATLHNTGNGSVVAYMCQRVNNRWKCGCRDRACTRAYWQRQDFVAGDVVLKNSILQSENRGLTFEPHFRILTDDDTELGPVDVQSISFNPETRNTLVVSSDTDGLFFRNSNVNLWKQMPFPPQEVYSFIVDAKSPDTRAFATGVVDDNGRVFRTEDWGNTWRTVYAEPGDRTTVTALTQDPRNLNLILAGTSGGTVVRSKDRGDTWENIGQNIGGKVEHFTHDATKKSFVYLLMRGGKVYHSRDAGRIWLNWEEEKKKEVDELRAEIRELTSEGDTEGADELDEEMDELIERNKTNKAPRGIVYIVADPSRSRVIYAGLTSGLYRSTDYGKYWERVNIIESAERYPIRSVAVSPKDSDEISFVSGSSFYRSINYGRTWSVTPLNTKRDASFVAYDPFSSSRLYVGLGDD